MLVYWLLFIFWIVVSDTRWKFVFKFPINLKFFSCDLSSFSFRFQASFFDIQVVLFLYVRLNASVCFNILFFFFHQSFFFEWFLFFLMHSFYYFLNSLIFYFERFHCWQWNHFRFINSSLSRSNHHTNEEQQMKFVNELWFERSYWKREKKVCQLKSKKKERCAFPNTKIENCTTNCFHWEWVYKNSCIVWE